MIDVKLPSSQTVMKEVKVDNLSAWGNLATGAGKVSQPTSPGADKSVSSPGPGDSTFAEFKRKALEQQQKVSATLRSDGCMLLLRLMWLTTKG